MCSNILIANEKARWGAGGGCVRRAVVVFGGRGLGFSLLTTDGPGHARELGERAAIEGAETVVVIGGDGTINEVLNGMLGSGVDRIPRLGIIPAGSSNDLSKCLGIPQKVRQACETIIKGRTRFIDVGEVGAYDEEEACGGEPCPKPSALRLPPSDLEQSLEGTVGRPLGDVQYFCVASSIGLFADVAAESVKLKRLTGAVRYLVAGLGVVVRLGVGWEMSVRADGKAFQGNYGVLLVSNTARFGGLTLSPGAKCDDGLFDCLLVDMPTRLEALHLMSLAVRKGLRRHRKVTAFQAESLCITLSRAGRLCNDGEVHSLDSEEIRYRILPRRLEVICPL